jgi:hypothetical protein
MENIGEGTADRISRMTMRDTVICPPILEDCMKRRLPANRLP